MNGDQIEKFLAQSLACTRTHFLGVFARDQLPTASKYPACFEANTDPISLPGTHWVEFFYVSPTHLEFFDSYGEPPHFYNFSISNKITTLKSNSQPLQNLRTTVCGQFCIYYLFNDPVACQWLESLALLDQPPIPISCQIFCSQN